MICETASVKASGNGLEAKIGDPDEESQTDPPERRHRGHHHEEYDRKGRRDGKKRRIFDFKSDRRHNNNDEDESLWDCDDLACSVEWVLQYILDTATYPVRRLTD